MKHYRLLEKKKKKIIEARRSDQAIGASLDRCINNDYIVMKITEDLRRIEYQYLSNGGPDIGIAGLIRTEVRAAIRDAWQAGANQLW